MTRNDWIAYATRLQAAQQAFALVTVLRAQAPTSAKAGDKALVTADGQIHGWIGGQPQSIRIAPTDETAERTLGDVLEFGMACHSGGTLELFIDPVLPATQLTVFGDSPVARSLAELAPRVGLRVALVAEGAQGSDHPDAACVLDSDDAARVREQLSSGGYAVVATQGRRDLQGLKAALALSPSHLWFVASERKAGVLRQSLISAGEDTDSVARIIAPAGESIGAHTPEEIALAVLAAVIAARRGRVPVAQPKGPEVALVAAKASAPVEAATGGGGCCGGAKKEAAPIPVETTAPAKNSYCGN